MVAVFPLVLGVFFVMAGISLSVTSLGLQIKVGRRVSYTVRAAAAITGQLNIGGGEQYTMRGVVREIVSGSAKVEWDELQYVNTWRRAGPQPNPPSADWEKNYFGIYPNTPILLASDIPGLIPVSRLVKLGLF